MPGGYIAPRRILQNFKKALTYFLVCAALCADTDAQERAIDDASRYNAGYLPVR